MLRDIDPLVISSAILALNEILQEDGGIVVTQKMIVYILNRIRVKF